ncbi:MAG: hypothetical protein JO309_14225 [Pseudonocardiales bacterium]|nr:hypothetical protein [Pseudonocardiales bacterium]
MAATDCHRRALERSAFNRTGEGIFGGWQWWRGADRVVWRPSGGDTVYKIQIAGSDLSNWREHKNISKWQLIIFDLDLCRYGYLLPSFP